MAYLAIATAVNIPGRRDGDYFCSEMKRAAAFWAATWEDQTVLTFKLKRRGAARRRADVRDAISMLDPEDAPPGVVDLSPSVPEPLDLFAVFGHGTWKSLPAGGYNRLNVYDLAEELAARVVDKQTTLKVVLYCCSCGAGRGKYSSPALTLPPVDEAEVPMKAGFAMRLGGALAEYGVPFEILAHTNRGKAAKNPFVVRITGGGDWQVIERREVVPFVPRSRAKKDAQGRRDWLTWRRLLADDPRFRFQFPFLTDDEIRRRLRDEQDAEK
ncbi:MAG: hypothetical protein GWN87_24995 [Desulfuromonadales bacterium]|nr:hypothetical protein [Desulfuromonadales bacterium]